MTSTPDAPRAMEDEALPVEVTQADRDAAADLLTAQLGPSASRHAGPEKARSGANDHGLMIQAFARHRIAATPPRAKPEERVREFVEAADYYVSRLHGAWMAKVVRDMDEAADRYVNARAASERTNDHARRTARCD